MTKDYTARTLAALQQAVEATPLQRPEPMHGDKWLLASAVQKAIRRGDVDCALRAGYALWCQDKQSFWRRLHIASVEDVGVVNVPVIVDTLTATAAPLWRHRVGDLRMGLHLIARLCASDKTRLADELLIAAEKSPAYARLRDRLAKAEDAALVRIIHAPERPLIQRCLAVWYLAGMRRYPSALMPNRKGSVETAVEVLRGLKDAPAALVESCISVMGRTQWPLAAFTPVIWQAAQEHLPHAAVHIEPLKPLPTVNGVPVYACDMFTRLGQSAFRKLQREVKALRMFSVQQIGIAQFYQEGGVVDRCVSSPFFDDFRTGGAFADAEAAGLAPPDYLALCDVLNTSQDHLNDLRKRELVRYFEGADSDLFTSAGG